jgi:glycosyltransferase involved in cell wall biosynthesis
MEGSRSSQISAGTMTHGQTPAKISAPVEKKTIKVYIMDLWSIIPFYIGHLCTSLKRQSADVTLGSVRYHLDRDYFHRMGLIPDRVLLDLGGRFRSNLLRRPFKCSEYVTNLCLLALRFTLWRPDVLHVEFLPFLDRGFSFEVWFLKWVQALRVRIVYTVHNVTSQHAPGRHKHLYARAYGMADTVICHGEEAAKELVRDLGLSPEKIRVIPHGPLFAEHTEASQEAARTHLGLPTATPVVLCLGVISEYKGIPFLLDAWKRLMNSGVKAILVIAGSGEKGLLSSIQAKVQQEGLESSVELRLQYIPVGEIPLLHQASDILVYPYNACTTSGALLTGMNYKRAIVATTLPCFQELLAHERSALLVDHSDAAGLAAALGRLIVNPVERARLGEAVLRPEAADSSWDQIALATIQCYQTLLHAKQHANS